MSQINSFYINKPSNFTELNVFKLYTFSLTKIFANYDSKLNLTVIKDNSFKQIRNKIISKKYK